MLGDVTGNDGQINLSGTAVVEGPVGGFLTGISIQDAAHVGGPLASDTEGDLQITGGSIDGLIRASYVAIGIAGGEFRNGLQTLDTITSVSGGSFFGADGEIGGGALSGPFFGSSDAGLSVSDGVFRGGDGTLEGGTAVTAILRGSAAAPVSYIDGGEFDAGFGSLSDGWLLALMSLPQDRQTFAMRGGRWGYGNVGRGLGVFGETTLNVYGSELEIDGDVLSGYLEDGSWIETPFTLGHAAAINLVEVAVPEPSAFGLGLLCLLGVQLRRSDRAAVG